MNHGPHEARLRSIDAVASKAAVNHSQQVWNKGGVVLEDIAQTLALAAGPMKGQLGTVTGQAAHDAFVKAAENVRKRSAQMVDAGDALLIASTAIDHSEQVRIKLDNNPLGPPPTAPTTTPGSSHPDDVDKQRAYHSEKASYEAAAQQRESEAEAANTNMDARYAEASSMLQQVHGEPDPPPTGPTSPAGPGGGGGGATPGSGPRTSTGTPYSSSTGGHVVPTGGGHHPPPTDGGGDPGHDPDHPNDPDTGGGGAQSGLPATSIDGHPTTPGTALPGGSVPTSGPGAPGGITGSTAGGIAGAVGGGVIGGMTGIGGAVRGPMAVPTGSSAGGATGRIGASSRSAGAARGVLGRTSGLAEEGTAGGRSGAAASARSAGAGTRGGGRAGSRGAAGGRGTGASGGQGGKNKKAPKKKGAEFFEDEQDWVDDEGAAPGVID